MKRMVTVHLPADRHADPHGRAFADTRQATTPYDTLSAAVVSALDALNLTNSRDKAVITVDWPHE